MALCISEEARGEPLGWESGGARALVTPSHKPSVVIWVTCKKKKLFKCFHKLMQPSPQSNENLSLPREAAHAPSPATHHFQRPSAPEADRWSVSVDLPTPDISISGTAYAHPLVTGFAHFIHLKLIQGLACDSSKGLHSSSQLNYIPVYTYPISCLSLYQ